LGQATAFATTLMIAFEYGLLLFPFPFPFGFLFRLMLLFSYFGGLASLNPWPAPSDKVLCVSAG